MERPGLKATNFRADGHAAHIEQSRTDGSRMVVDRGVHGERSVQVVRRDGVRIVSSGRQGFVERPLRAGFVSRTYVYGGRTEVRVYRSYTFGRVHYFNYVPSVYYRPAFYGWAYRPWGAPVVYGWGWGRPAWFYDGYFAPERAYPSAAFWLTDYLLAENLQLAYQNQVAAGAEAQADFQYSLAQNSPAPLTPEVKREIAEQVQWQLEADQAAAAQPGSGMFAGAAVPDAPPPALDAKLKVFVVFTGLNLTAGSDGQACVVTPGDIIERRGRTVTPDGQVPIRVMDTKIGDCPVGFATVLDVSLLQDMYNQFREQISAGLGKLASAQGRGGVPAGPAADPQQVADGQAAPAPDAQDLVAKQDQAANQTEAEVNQASGGGQ